MHQLSCSLHLSCIPALFPQALKGHDATLECLSLLKGLLYRLAHRKRPDYGGASFEFRPLFVRSEAATLYDPLRARPAVAAVDQR